MLDWSESEDKKLFELYKNFGTNWKEMTLHLPGKNRNDIKNRFYSTLRRVIKKLNIDSNMAPKDFLAYTDIAESIGRSCYSKRGRKRRCKIQDQRNEKCKKGNSEGKNIYEFKNQVACSLLNEKGKTTDYNMDYEEKNDQLDLDIDDAKFFGLKSFPDDSLEGDLKEIEFGPLIDDKNKVY